MGYGQGNGMSRDQMKLLWSPDARRDVIRLREFIKTKNPYAAQKAAQTIRKAINLIRENPYIKNKIEGREDRELFTSFGKRGYILRYRIEKETIIILRIWHTRENR